MASKEDLIRQITEAMQEDAELDREVRRLEKQKEAKKAHQPSPAELQERLEVLKVNISQKKAKKKVLESEVAE